MNHKWISPTVADGTLYTAFFEAMPGNHMLLQANPPHYTILAVTPQRQIDVGLTKEAVMGKPLFIMHPGNSTDPTDNGVSNLRSSLEHVMRYRELHHLPVQRYDLPNADGTFSEKYWSASNSPVLNEEGEVAYIIHSAEDITAQVKAEKKEEAHRELQKAYNKIEESSAQLKAVVEQTPAPTLVLRGDELRIELINRPMLQMIGRDEEVIGQPLLAIMPELKGQYAWEQAQGVYREGLSFDQDEALVRHNRTGVMQDFYYKVAYRPLKEDDQITGMIQVALDVTEQVMSRKALEESKAQLAFAIDATELGVWDYNPITNKFSANDRMRGWFGLQQNEEFDLALGIAGIEESDRQRVAEAIQKASTWGGGDYDIEYTIINPQTGQRRIVRAKGKATFGEDKLADRFNGTLQDVTVQAGARRRIEESEQKLQLALSAGNMGTFVWHPQEDQGEPDERMLNLFGISKSSKLNLAEALGSIIHPDDGLRYAEEVKAAINLSGNGVLHSEFRITHPDQTVHWIAIHGQTYFDAETKAPVRMSGMATDITRQVEARKKLEESESRFRNLVRDASVAIVVLTGTEMITEVVNEAFGKLIGRTPEELLEKPLFTLIPETEAYYRPICEKVRQTGEPVYLRDSPYTVVADEKQIDGFLHLTYQPYRDAQRNILGVMILCQDVTESVKARKALEQSELRFRNLVEEATVATAVLEGPEWVLTLVNDQMLNIWQRSRSIIGIKLLQFMPELIGQPFPDLLKGVYTSGSTYSDQDALVTLNRNGVMEDVYMDFSYKALRNSAGEVYAILVAAADVTERYTSTRKLEESEARYKILSQTLEDQVNERTKELEKANQVLQDTNKELQRSNAHLEEFAHAASHDLKEPVRKIHYFTQHLKEQLGGGFKEAEAKSFNRIENATERMGNLIDDLLLYSHVSQRPHETESVDLNEKIKRVLEDLELDIQEKGAVINVATLPVVKGYRRQLQQLFQNLLSNALKYSKTDVAPQISITAGSTEMNGKDYHLIKVQDNGIGFPQEYDEKIFQMFSRLHSKNEYNGTGVGLSIVKKVIENHHGHIKVESAPGKGSTFSVLLPVE